MQAYYPSSSDFDEQDTHGWAALDDSAEWLTFSEPATSDQPAVWESRIAVEGMHCAACGFAVEKALASVKGVLSAEVSASSGRARVVWSATKTKPSEWMRVVSQAGYRAFPRTEIGNERRKQQRLLMWRWAVAGFCMMQVMMYAYPVYVAAPGEITPDIASLLRWASWVLTLPVMLFSSGPFFTSALNDLKQRRISMDLPVVLGILITFFVSSAATFQPNGWWGTEVYFDSLTMFVFFLLSGRWLEARMRDRTAGALDTLMRRLPASIERKNSDGSYERVAVRRLQVGDVVRVLPGEAFPADGRIILGDTTADEALLTGESRPVSKPFGAEVIAGSHNLSAAVEMHIKHIGTATQYAQIVALMERVAVDKPRLALLTDRVAKPFLILVLLSAVGSALLLWQAGHGVALMAAAAVLIVTCPCALSLATPAAMLASAGALASKGILVRRLQALEAIANIDSIVFDKTGTLTDDHLKIATINTYQGMSEPEALKLAASIARHSLHPVSRALVTAWGDETYDSVSNIEEIAGSGVSAMSISGTIRLGSARHCSVTPGQMEATQVYMCNDSGLLAIFTLEENIRSDAEAAVQSLLSYGLNVSMLSGDRASAAQRVATQLGIQDVLSDCSPQQKLSHMQQMQSQGWKIAMVGDGLNDGPVLVGAHVSVAIGQAVPLAQAQSDFVIQGGQLMLLPQLIVQARKTMRVVKQNLLWAGAYNAVCVPLAVLGYLPAWLAGLGMASSSLLVVLNATRLARTRQGQGVI